MPSVEPLECGGYELVKLINRFPIHFFIQCFFRNKKIRGKKIPSTYLLVLIEDEVLTMI